MENSHADHRGVHNRVLGEPEETPSWSWTLLNKDRLPTSPPNHLP